jgi:hypothetical protein
MDGPRAGVGSRRSTKCASVPYQSRSPATIAAIRSHAYGDHDMVDSLRRAYAEHEDGGGEDRDQNVFPCDFHWFIPRRAASTPGAPDSLTAWKTGRVLPISAA